MVAVPVREPLQIRQMQRGDLAQVAFIEAMAYEFPWSPGIFRDCLQAGYHCWVLVTGHHVCSYGVLSVVAREAHLLNLCVAPAEQGLGLGRRMLSRMLDMARWHGTDKVFLEVRPSNRRAVRLYGKYGFTRIGKRPRYYPTRQGREDAMVMVLNLRLPAEGLPKP